MPARHRSRSQPPADLFAPLVLDELERFVRRIDWGIEQPRRGRPPRWLVALRAQEDAA